MTGLSAEFTIVILFLPMTITGFIISEQSFICYFPTLLLIGLTLLGMFLAMVSGY